LVDEADGIRHKKINERLEKLENQQTVKDFIPGSTTKLDEMEKKLGVILKFLKDNSKSPR